MANLRNERVHWFDLSDGRYVKREPEDGIFKSRQVPGLWLNASAVFPIDGPKLLSTLAEGMSTPEFAEYRDRGRHA